ncbi:MAG: hypothetical protein JRI55_10855, partial [Deltaproteobacteria bacterium]|nr:hypothetical protein [Deltaproteobacteria bacterium]
MAESSGHLVLALGQAMQGLPLRVTLDGVTLGTDGKVRLAGAPKPVSPVASVQSERELLAALLTVSHGPAPALRALGAGARIGHGDDQESWLSDLASALIPINRGAAKRALARLARETIRAKGRGMLVTPSGLPPVAESTSPDVAPELAAETSAASQGTEEALELSVEIPIDFSEPIEPVAEPTPTATEVDAVADEGAPAPADEPAP